METRTQEAAAASGGEHWGYRPHLDGLRALAVYLVVGFHAGLGRLAGGFVGVDVFFVLSGYLVTNVLLRDLSATGGRIRFGRFYARRARRLLPAATVVLVATAVVWSLVAGPVEVVEARAGLRAAALYVSNWYFISEATSYFGSDVDGSPVAHFWSLSVEEQFYVFWPVLLSGLFWFGSRFGRRRDLVVRLSIAALGLASVGLALLWSESRPDRAYFGTDTRAYQLLAGALLAMLPGVVRRVRRLGSSRVVAGAGVALVGVLGLLASDQVAVNPVQRGVLVTVVVVLLLVALEAAPTGWAAQAFSVAPLVYLGKISYGTYLWHWLVTLVADRELELSDPVTAVLVAVVATGIASLSYHLMELPVREWSRLDAVAWRLPVVGAGVAMSLVVALVVVPRVDSRLEVVAGDPTEMSSEVRAVLTHLTPVPGSVDHSAVFLDVLDPEMDCVDGPATDCIVVDGSGPTVLLLGDSNAHMVLPGFIALAEEHGFTLVDATTSGCPWQKDLLYNFAPDRDDVCRRVRSDTYERIVPELDPDVIVVMNARREFAPFSEDDDRQVTLRTRILESLDLLSAPDRVIAVLEEVPRESQKGFNSAGCLQRASYVEECRFTAAPSPSWVESLLRAEAEQRDDLVTVDLDHLACPMLPVCDAMVEDTVVWRVEGHLSGTYVREIAWRIEQALRAQEIDLR